MKTPSLAMAAAVLMATSASAQPPPQGWIGPLSQPSILCDTSTQLQSIVDAFEDGMEAAHARFTELYRTPNGRHEPTCAVVVIRLAQLVESTRLGRITIGGHDVYGWMIHIENEGGEGYYLYLESPTEALRDTI